MASKNKSIPVFQIGKFTPEDEFYASDLKSHLKDHAFINVPHKHNFYLTVLFIKGSGTHTIDFITYQVKPGSLFSLFPGQSHNWNLSPDIDGYIFFHTKEFYNQYYLKKIEDFSFFSFLKNENAFDMGPSYKYIESLFQDILEEYIRDQMLKAERLHALIDLIYIEISRTHKGSTKDISSNSMGLLSKLEKLIDENYIKTKSPSEYAELMHVSEKHLNRICKTTLGRTLSDIILERVMLESKRLLAHTDKSITDIAESLGYTDISYFGRQFKKRYSLSPLSFRKSIKIIS